MVKSAAIDPSVIGDDGVFRHTGPAKVFTSEKAAIKAIKQSKVAAGDIMIVLSRPLGTGMEETYQLTSALKKVPYGKHFADHRCAFSGVSTGACFGHVGPEALAGGPIGKLRDGDHRDVVDTVGLTGSLNHQPDEPLTPPSARRSSLLARPIPGWLPTATCPTTPGCGLRCRTSPGAPGAAASMTWTASSRCSRPARRHWPPSSELCPPPAVVASAAVGRVTSRTPGPAYRLGLDGAPRPPEIVAQQHLDQAVDAAQIIGRPLGKRLVNGRIQPQQDGLA